MIDLKNFGGGRKLIKKIIRQDPTNKPWSQVELFKKLKRQKNNNFKKP
jgi:hypothetical protein